MSQAIKQLMLKRIQSDLNQDQVLLNAVLNGTKAYNMLIAERAEIYADQAVKTQHERVLMISRVSGKSCKAQQKPRSAFIAHYKAKYFALYNQYKAVALSLNSRMRVVIA